ncbi:BnaC07g48710D [Brassica napus]|uniref:BnaC07g48710D protein n=1 Tax=Brassica napus TaxID=3708 RepID=A0A078J2B0_BRANA|nr:BnaC07g48710D [Brassica napus]
MLREFSKRPDVGRNKRMEALKNNDVERYREMLLEQQTNIPGERYTVLSSFFTQTEDYLHKLGGKITATKNQQEVEGAANAAAIAARLQGLSEEEVRAAAACAREEVVIRNRFVEMNAPKDNSSVNKYYTSGSCCRCSITSWYLFHTGSVSLYCVVLYGSWKNCAGGTDCLPYGVQGDYGPHLIIVPNTVLVNWKVCDLFFFFFCRVNSILGCHMFHAYIMLVQRINVQSCSLSHLSFSSLLFCLASTPVVKEDRGPFYFVRIMIFLRIFSPTMGESYGEIILRGLVVIKKSLPRKIPILQNLRQKIRDRKRWLLLFLQKEFGSLSAFDTRPGSVSKRLEDDLEDGEIGASGDSHRDLQRSYDRDEGEENRLIHPRGLGVYLQRFSFKGYK